MSEQNFTNKNSTSIFNTNIDTKRNVNSSYSLRDTKINANINTINNNTKLTENNLSFQFTNEKAGMQGLDREEIDKIIYEATKDSVITKKKMEDLEKIKLMVEDYKMKLDNLYKNELLLEQNSKLADSRIREIRKERIVDRIWMHIDMDMFYAAVELRDQPELRDKPVAVGNERMVSTSNYLARKFGVRSAMPGFIGKKLCKDLVFIAPNFHKYETESKKIMKILKYYDPDIEVRGLDEAYLDLTNYCLLNYITSENEIRDLIKEIKNKIKDETQLTSSCGVACNKMLAKICSDIQKPDGLYVLPNDIETIEKFMKVLKVRKIPHVGEKLEKKLNFLNIFTCTDVLNRHVDLFHLFTENQFDFLMASCYGLAPCYHEEVKESINKSISCSETFKITNEMAFISNQFRSLCKRVFQKMTEQSVIAKTITIETTDKNEKHTAKSLSMIKRFETEAELVNNGWTLLKSMLNGNICIRLLRVKISSLQQVNPATLKKKEENQIKHWINKLQTNSANEISSPVTRSHSAHKIPSISKPSNKDNSKQRDKKSFTNAFIDIEKMITIMKENPVKKVVDLNNINGKNVISTPGKNILKRKSNTSNSSKSKSKSNKNIKKNKKNTKKDSNKIGPMDNFVKINK